MRNWWCLWCVVCLLVSGQYACSATGCNKACKQADACPDVAADYTVGVQTLQTDCTSIYPLSLTLSVVATSQPDFTSLDMEVTDFSDQMTGELCNTSSESFPKLYDFSAFSATSVGNDQLSYFISGQFIVSEDATVDVCANFVFSRDVAGDSCRDSLMLYTSSSLCD